MPLKIKTILISQVASTDFTRFLFTIVTQGLILYVKPLLYLKQNENPSGRSEHYLRDHSLYGPTEAILPPGIIELHNNIDNSFAVLQHHRQPEPFWQQQRYSLYVLNHDLKDLS